MKWPLLFEQFLRDQNHDDVAHDLDHIRRVVANAERLAEREKARLEIVEPAAWLHDCVIVRKDSPDRARASGLAAEKATEFLRSAEYEERWIPDIAHAIEAHSFSAGIPPRTREAQVVQDADRLDAVGAIGVARCLMTGAALGSRLYEPNDPFCRRREAHDRVSTIDHFYTKLLGLAETMQTEAGRAEARARTDFMIEYLQQLEREIPGPPSTREANS